MEILRWTVLGAAAWCVVALAWQYRAMKRFGARRLHAPAAGREAEGIRYAFTAGMAPGAKESVRMNPVSYALGMAYHLGVFAGLALLAMDLAGAPSFRILGAAALLGACGGAALLVKRGVTRWLRSLSHPDDYLSNALATAFALLAGLAAYAPSLMPTWRVVGALLFLYAPLGKIRHCVFFFPTRAHFGAFFGRRGVLPRRAEGAL